MIQQRADAICTCVWVPFFGTTYTHFVSCTHSGFPHSAAAMPYMKQHCPENGSRRKPSIQRRRRSKEWSSSHSEVAIHT